MRETPLHSWTLSPKEAIRLQETLSERLVLSWDGRDVSTVAGVDVSVKEGVSRAAIVVLTLPDFGLLEAAVAEAPTPFPYVPGLLTFREGPVVLRAWSKLTRTPDVALFDGQGIAHPRRMGLAAHLGLWLEVPTIGCAKSRLYGAHDPVGARKGDRTPLMDARDGTSVVGCVLRTRENVRPVFVSPGHLIDVAAAAELALRCCTRYRLPEPTRWAHKVAGGERVGETAA